MVIAVGILIASGLDIFAATPKGALFQTSIHFWGSNIYVLCGGLAVAEIYFCAVVSKSWNWTRPFIIYPLLLYGVWYAPQRLGTDKAHSHLVAPAKTLPRVFTNNPADPQVTYLIEIIQGNALLLIRTPPSEVRTFRFAKIIDIAEIVPSSGWIALRPLQHLCECKQLTLRSIAFRLSSGSADCPVLHCSHS